MQLGHLHKAPADCTASLKYGHIPDAYHKQLALMARLGITPTLWTRVGKLPAIASGLAGL